MASELKSCPNCKGVNLSSQDSRWCYVDCHGCGMAGPSADNKEEAERLWNAFPREPFGVVWSSERPKAEGKYWVRFADPRNRPLRNPWVIEIDQDRLEATAGLGASNCQFAGPLPEPVEPST